jgi:hypothetical protein
MFANPSRAWVTARTHGADSSTPRPGTRIAMIDEERKGADPHTSAEEGHPAAEGERTDRDIGGPTPSEDESGGDVEGGGPSPKPSDEGLEPHE